jgi:hypothetical protein
MGKLPTPKTLLSSRSQAPAWERNSRGSTQSLVQEQSLHCCIPCQRQGTRYEVGLNIRVTQQIPENVGFRSSTQPTLELFFRQNLRSIEI